MAPPGALNAEPSKPAERKRQHLPPRSYADIAVEEPKSAPKVNSTTNGPNGASNEPSGKENGSSAVPRTAPILKIVSAIAKEKEARTEPERQESNREYTASGLDESQKTPPKKKNNRKAATQKLGEQPQRTRTDASSEYAEGHKAAATHSGLPENDATAQHVESPKNKIKKNAASNIVKEPSYSHSEDSQNGSKDANGGSAPSSKEQPEASNTPKGISKQHSTIFEKVEGSQNGSNLVTVKSASADGKTQSKDQPKDTKVLNRSSKKDQEESLASGKIAGQRWHNSGIRFAPMNVPLQRRLQTLVVLLHTLCIAICVSLFFFLCAIPLFWPLLIPYMIYCLTSKASTSGTLTHRLEFFRRSPIWSLFASYFPARLHRTQELPPTRKYIFGYHPHGILSLGAFGAFATEALGFSQLFPGIKNTLLTLDSNFRIPLYRDYALAMGIASVSKESCENLLSKGGPNNEGMGRAITIVIGGASESLDAQPYSLRLILKRRKGFVKMAIRTGADLVPVLSFGENDLYDQYNVDSHPRVHKFQLLVKKVLGFTIPLFHARGVFNYDVGLMPYRRPINIVVGRPIRVVQAAKPEQSEIDRVHEEYVTELERLWDMWKDEFAPNRKEEMQIME
ncbi:hypothetical protein HYFRA_00007910 [Hymenoscyphus fraxineus]|uniref:diacylglycerol O-acyltransferase n=1 Tax=Hymenoscyphus fraxineus TaxID=746836 RepID=A0A9N9KNT2_9HELO|nr:hypothetical protein HYFRA_00007910 [Hymenoscyphus fraxineus]